MGVVGAGAGAETTGKQGLLALKAQPVATSAKVQVQEGKPKQKINRKTERETERETQNRYI